MFAFRERSQKWVPIDPATARQSDAAFEGGIYLNPWHSIHKCADVPTQNPAYARLYLVSGAPMNVVTAAYRALAAEHHPDKGGSLVKMQEINLAFEAIKRASN